MIVTNQDFITRVEELYRQNPGAISNIAYHKLENFLQEATTYQIDTGDTHGLYAVRKNQLIFYWSNQQERFLVPPEQLHELKFLVIHESFYRLIAQACNRLRVAENYPLFYDHSWSQSPPASERYEISDFNFADEQDYEVAGRIITGTGAGYTVTADRIRGWLDDRAFAPNLWLLARERSSGQPVGVGISGYYAPMQEADLDWFFVDPAHQGQGIGRLLIAATIRRCLPQAEIIRLSGIADGFYQKCGFQRGDKWFILHE